MKLGSQEELRQMKGDLQEFQDGYGRRNEDTVKER